jgi:hypothetical protein
MLHALPASLSTRDYMKACHPEDILYAFKYSAT